MSHTPRRWLTLLAAAAGAALPALAASAAAACHGALSRDHRLYVEAYDAAAAFPEVDAKLSKGLAVTIAHEARWPGRPPVLFGCKIYYDLWDEAYYVNVLRGSLAATTDRRTLRGRAEALRFCYTTTLTGEVPAAGAFELVTHLDPVSDEVLAKTRQWLAEKGISGTSGALFSRAAFAIIDFPQRQAITRQCPVGAAP